MLRVENLSKSFETKTAVDSISFSIKPGVITGLLGPNGAGKTTTMRLISGYLKPTSGNIFYQDHSTLENPDFIKSKLGYLPESAPLYPEMLVSEYLQFMGEVRKVTKENVKNSIQKMVDVCELSSHFKSQISTLSKGFKQRVALAGTLIHDPEIIILDEPTSGLDPNQISHIRQLIKNLGKQKTLVLSTHILQEVEDICDEVVIISKGKIVSNSKVSDLHGKHQVLIDVKATEDKVQKIFSTNEFVSVQKFTDEDKPASDFQTYLIQLKENTPEIVFEKLSKSECKVREIKSFKRSLESVFEELTRN